MFSLNHFYKLPSVVQILFAEFLMTMFLGGLAPYAYRAMWPRPLSYTPLPLEFSDFAFGAGGLALLIWLMWGPLFPRVAEVSWTPVFRAGSAFVPMPSASVDYGFVTNHPSYVFIDFIIIFFWWFLRYLMIEGDPERLYEANLWVSVAAVVPAWRLICWYGLRRRPAAGAEETVRNAWKPIAQLYLFFIAPLAAVFLYAFVYETVKARRILATMPTIEAANFSEQAFAALRDPEIKDKEVTRLLRLRAIQVSAQANLCHDRERRPSVTVLADFGPHGGLIILNDRTLRDDRNLETLKERARDNAGRPIEAQGRLLRLPADREIPAWRRPFYCGLERAQPRPRWVLEESRP
jgi:hypothetical protein